MKMAKQTEKEREEIERKTLEEIEKSIFRMETGLIGAKRKEALHAKFALLIPKKITMTNTHSLAFAVRSSGISIMVNPDYFLQTLKTTEERMSAIRHIEQHVYLHHPQRELAYKHICQEEERPFYPALFHICAEIEANSFISGYEKLKHSITAETFHDIYPDIPKAASAESLYLLLLPKWEEDPEQFTKHVTSSCPCDQRHWQGEKTFNEQGILQNTDIPDLFTWDLIKKELDRIAIVARETMDIGHINSLSKEENGRFDGLLQRYNLKRTDPKIAEACEQEINSILVKMLISDPFFGQFISGCVRQITDTIQTAGVAVLKKYVALLVNPSFFMEELKNTKERAAVLKHEALHIMLKHIVQMRDDKFPDKRLYNIAADLEVNQYIGSPWQLPKGAILLSSFPKLELPKNDIAETYYPLLLKEAQTNSKAGKAIKDMLLQDDPIGGHSDHGAWDESNDLNSGLNSASDPDLEAHGMDIERQVQQAYDSLNAKQKGNMPGTFLKLLDEWAKAREPSIDWKRELRLFVSSNPSTTVKKTHRKKNKRYFNWLRESLKAYRISTDAINLLARENASLLPKLTWGELPQDIIDTILENRPKLKIPSKSTLLNWKTLPFYAIWKIQNHFPDLQWPQWQDLSEAQLKRLNLIRTPLDPKSIPTDLYIVIANRYPNLLPKLRWDIFNATKYHEIRKNHPYLVGLEFPTWSILPSELVIYLRQHNPELFTLTWKDIPPQLLTDLPFFKLVGNQPFRIDRKIERSLPGLKKERNYPKILVILDTSGSVSSRDIEYFFYEIHGMYKMGVEIYVLEADTRPCLFFKYNGRNPVAGRGGTAFDPALDWVNQAKDGADIRVQIDDKLNTEKQKVQIRFDGVIYLSDGEASTPKIKPYCRMMWVLTPNGTDEMVKQCDFSGPILKLPAYDKR